MDWAPYDRWIDPLVEVVFPIVDSPVPVFLDLEDAAIAALGEAVGVAAGNVVEQLCTDVRATLVTCTGESVFSLHRGRLKTWRPRFKTPPPVLPLLATFSIAAERMSRGDGFTSSNYFGRLRQLFKLNGESPIDSHYRREAETYWSSLNRWLLSLDGQRGLPTAFAVGKRYIGLPMSQALIRATDRDRLTNFFRKFNLPPGAGVAGEDLEPLLDGWINLVPSPATTNLIRLWGRPDARRRIAEVAATVLAGWDGTVPDAQLSEVGGQEIRLAVEIGRFPRRQVGLMLLAYAKMPDQPREFVFQTAEGERQVALVPAVPGALGTPAGARIDHGSLLEGVLAIKDSRTGDVLMRRPRKLVSFRRDELSMVFIETDQVQLGEEMVLLVQDEILDKVSDVLGAIARPGFGFASPEEYPGLPDGWSLVTGVQILSSPPQDIVGQGLNDLTALVPLAMSQIKLTGGFALPGGIRRFHSWRPPEITAVSEASRSFVVRLVGLIEDDAGEGRLLAEFPSTDGIVVQSLEPLELDDGPYRLELVAGGPDPITTTTFHLFSSDSPDLVQWERATEIFSPVTPLGVIGAERGGSDAAVLVRGAQIAGEVPSGGEPRGQAPRDVVWRTTPRDGERTPFISLAKPDPDSCLFTGRHREEIDQVALDKHYRPVARWTTGRCSGCGQVRRYPTKPRKAGAPTARSEPAQAVARRSVASLTPIDTKSHRDWGIALDALIHVGGGSWSSLTKIALQVEPTALFVDQLARGLEALGHIEVRRDPLDLTPVEWEIAPATLVETAGEWVVAGAWSSQDSDDLLHAVEAMGGGIQKHSSEDQPEPWFVVGLTRAQAEEVSNKIADVTVEDGFAARLARSLPPLSEVVRALPRRALSDQGRIRRFDVQTAGWRDATSIAHPGAYRLSRFTTLDVVRLPQDVEQGAVAMSTVHLSKHVAALMEGRVLISYDAQTRTLAVPLGAELPGLYGRAAVLASGLLPDADPGTRTLRYQNVPSEVAALLFERLRS